MVASDSPIWVLPEDVELRQRLFFESVATALKAIQGEYAALVTGISGFDDLDENQQLELLGRAWTIVDYTHRLKLIVSRFPGLKSTTAVKIFVRRAGKVEDLRHGFQHLDERLPEILERNFPILGFLTWVVLVSEGKWASSALIPGSIRQGMSVPIINPLDVEMRSEVDHIRLNAFDSVVDLSDLWLSCREFCGQLEAAVTRSLEDVSGDGPRLLLAP